MDDYISRQAAIKALNTEIIKRRLLDDVNDGMLDEFDTESILRALPSANVVEVVRCKDCKSFSHGYCKFHDAKFVREDGYCYWGEWKDGDTDG